MCFKCLKECQNTYLFGSYCLTTTLNLCVNHQQSDACPDPCTWIMTDTLPDDLIAENFLDEGDWVWIYHKQSPKCQQHNISRTCPCPWINQSLVVKTQKIF